MPAFNRDTTTLLNPASTLGGDSMDESTHYQSDGVIQAKSPRVVLAFDDGKLVSGALPMPVALSSSDHQVLQDIRSLLQKLVRLGGGIA